MGDSDQWPQIREKVLAADILVLSTPVWLGHPSSVAQRVLERLDAELADTDDAGRPVLTGKVAVVSVVVSEHGAHKAIADLFQSLNDIGYSVPAQGSTYWNGAAMESPTTTISTRYLRPSPQRRRRLRATSPTGPAHCGRRVSRPTNDVKRTTLWARFRTTRSTTPGQRDNALASR
jgi:hypothetical protein